MSNNEQNNANDGQSRAGEAGVNLTAVLERTAFDEWREKNWYLIDSVNNARIIWEAATLAEREACAKVAETHFIPGHSVAGPEFAKVLADKIRMRSNAKLRGATDD